MKQTNKLRNIFRSGLLLAMLAIACSTVAFGIAVVDEKGNKTYIPLAPTVQIVCQDSGHHPAIAVSAIEGTFRWKLDKDNNQYIYEITNVDPYIEEYNRQMKEIYGIDHTRYRAPTVITAKHKCTATSDSVVYFSNVGSTAPTCTKPGTQGGICYFCAKPYKDQVVPATGHSMVVKEIVYPTCTEKGYRLVYCANDFCDDHSVGTYDNPVREELSALGHISIGGAGHQHNRPAWFPSDGEIMNGTYNGYHYDTRPYALVCARCNVVYPTASNWDINNGTVTGSQDYCVRCAPWWWAGNFYSDREEAKGDTKYKAGDSFDLADLRDGSYHYDDAGQYVSHKPDMTGDNYDEEHRTYEKWRTDAVTLRVNFVDEEGNELATPYLREAYKGQSYQVKVPAIDGYEAQNCGSFLTVYRDKDAGKEDIIKTVTYKAVKPIEAPEAVDLDENSEENENPEENNLPGGPEVIDPEDVSGGPEGTEPIEPGATEPGTTEPGTTEPGTTEPGTTEPDTTEPGTTESGTTEPGTTEPDTTEPGTTEPDTTEPAGDTSGNTGDTSGNTGDTTGGNDANTSDVTSGSGETEPIVTALLSGSMRGLYRFNPALAGALGVSGVTSYAVPAADQVLDLSNVPEGRWKSEIKKASSGWKVIFPKQVYTFAEHPSKGDSRSPVYASTTGAGGKYYESPESVFTQYASGGKEAPTGSGVTYHTESYFRAFHGISNGSGISAPGEGYDDGLWRFGDNNDLTIAVDVVARDYTVTWYDADTGDVIKGPEVRYAEMTYDDQDNLLDERVAVTKEDKELEGYTFISDDLRNVLEGVVDPTNSEKVELKLYFSFKGELRVIAPDKEKTYDGKPLAADYTVQYRASDGSIKTVTEGDGAKIELTYPDGKLPVDAGTYKVTVKATYTANEREYTAETTATLTIRKVMLTVVTKSASKKYDGEPLTAPGTITGFVNNETLRFRVTGSRTEVGSSTNTYAVDWNNRTDEDYGFVYVYDDNGNKVLGDNGQYLTKEIEWSCDKTTAKECNYVISTILGSLIVTDAGEPPVPPPAEHTLTIHYRYDSRDGAEAAGDYVQSGLTVDMTYNVPSPEIAGYKADRTMVSGVMPDEDVVEWVIYTKVTTPDPKPTLYKLTINYVYEDGTQAAETYTENLRSGREYSVTSPEIEGYTPDQALVSGTMPAHDVTVTVVYTASSVDISDPDVPLVDIPDVDVPQIEAPEELVEIPEEDVPLADVPKTGDKTGVWRMLALLSAAGLMVLKAFERKQDDEA